MGRPSKLVDVGVRETVDALSVARDEIAKAIYDAPTLDSAWQRIGRWGPDGPAWHRLGDALFVSTVKADLAGQLMVKRDVGGGRFVFAPDGNTFLDKPWAEAIAEFKARGIVKPNELQTLLGDYAQRTVVARELMLQNIQKEVRAQLEKSLREGGTYQQFARAVNEQKVPLGIADYDPSYLAGVFRTNIQSAYGAGRFRAINDPVVLAERPFVEYRTVGDARVREEHKVLHKTVYRTDSDEWHRIAPPNGYSCRCACVPLTKDEIGDATVLSKPPKAYVPDPDFDTAPVARLPRALAAEAASPVHPPTPLIQVPEQLEAPPKNVTGQAADELAADVRRVLGVDLHELTGAKLAPELTFEIQKPRARPPRTTEAVDETRVAVEIKDDAGKNVGSFVRRYERNNDGSTSVHHQAFFLQPNQQGTGLGAKLFNAQIDAYEKAGIDRVDLDATSVGRYVWTKAGFDWTEPGQFENVRGQLKEYLATRYGEAAAEKLTSTVRTPQDIATLKVGDERVGKHFLINEMSDFIAMSQSPSGITRL